MTSFASDFLRELSQRGFIYQTTDAEGLDQLAAEQSIPLYIGFDATANSLHVGSLVQIMMLRWAQKTGHKPIVLMGGGTTKIGDPSDKDEMRRMLTPEQIDANIDGIASIFARYLTFGNGPADAVLVNNAEWLEKLNYIHLLRDVGRHFTINRMIGFESVQRRLEREQPLTFLEFNYMILQAFDFAELNRRFGCRLQCGGSEQWGNIVSGIELGRKMHGADLYGLTAPLITTSSGTKMGKTAAGAIWLNADLRSPYDFWQFWRNTEDADVGRFLRLFTELPMDEIARLETLEGQEVNEAKKILATAATTLCHGPEAADAAAQTAAEAFEQGARSAGLPSFDLPRSELDAGLPAFRLFHMAGLTKSGGEARRLIDQGGAKLNDGRLGEPEQVVTAAAVTSDGTIKLTAGKKRHILVRPV